MSSFTDSLKTKKKKARIKLFSGTNRKDIPVMPSTNFLITICSIRPHNRRTEMLFRNIKFDFAVIAHWTNGFLSEYNHNWNTGIPPNCVKNPRQNILKLHNTTTTIKHNNNKLKRNSSKKKYKQSNLKIGINNDLKKNHYEYSH